MIDCDACKKNHQLIINHPPMYGCVRDGL